MNTPHHLRSVLTASISATAARVVRANNCTLQHAAMKDAAGKRCRPHPLQQFPE